MMHSEAGLMFGKQTILSKVISELLIHHSLNDLRHVSQVDMGR